MSSLVLDVHRVGRRKVSVSGGRASVEKMDASDESEGRRPDFHLWTEPDTLIELVTGEARPLRLMMAAAACWIRGAPPRAQAASPDRRRGLLDRFPASGAEVDPDVLYRRCPT